jgi:hypothetical protein
LLMHCALHSRIMQRALCRVCCVLRTTHHAPRTTHHAPCTSPHASCTTVHAGTTRNAFVVAHRIHMLLCARIMHTDTHQTHNAHHAQHTHDHTARAFARHRRRQKACARHGYPMRSRMCATYATCALCALCSSCAACFACVVRGYSASCVGFSSSARRSSYARYKQEAWHMAHGTWCMEQGARSMAHGMRALRATSRIAQHAHL